jgi:HEAT repeat protein
MPSSGSSESAAGIVAGGRRRENNGLLRASARGEILVVTGMNVAESSLVRLLETRSNLTEEVLSYLDEVVARASELPPYFPAHLRKAGDGATGFEAIQQQVQVVEDRSRWDQSLAEESERLRAAGFDDRLAYAPNRARPESGEHEDQRDRPAPAPPLPWDYRAAERFRRAVILGDPGMGKSWLLRIEARRLAVDARRSIEARTQPVADIPVPILARLPDLNQSDGPIAEALITPASERRSESFRHWVRSRLACGRAVVLLDGWDEVPVERPEPGQPIAYRPHHQQRLGQRIQQFAQDFPENRLLLTSRVVGYVGAPFAGAQELELVAFDQPQIDQFARAWFGVEGTSPFIELLTKNPPMRGLARIPLILTLMCRAFLEKKLRFPTRRVDLYERCLLGLLRDWKEEKERREISDAEIEGQLDLLADAALALFEKNSNQFRVVELARELSRVACGKDRESLIAGWKRDGLVVRSGQDRDAPYVFLHRTFHEYLAARGLARRGWVAIRDLMDRKAWLPSWQETIVMLAGLLDDGVPLLELLADEQRDDLFRHRLALAARALAEVSATDRPNGPTERILEPLMRFWREHASFATLTVVDHVRHAMVALPSVLPALTELLRVRVRGVQSAADTVLFLGQAAESDEYEFSKRYPDAETNVRCAAIQALSEFGKAAASAVPDLIALLRDEHGCVRSAAVMALGRIGESAVPELSNLLGDEETFVRSSTVEALRELGPSAASAVPELVTVLRDENWYLRSRVVEVLVDLSAPAGCVMSELFELLRAEDFEMRSTGALLLACLGRSAVPELTKRLSDKDSNVRSTAAAALGAIGPFAASAVGALIYRLHDENSAVRASAAESLGKLGPSAAHAGSELMTLLRDDDSEVRSAAVGAIYGLGPFIASAIPELMEFLHDQDAVVRSGAARALGGFGSFAACAVPDLINRLTNESSDAILPTAWALRDLGPSVASAVPDLIALLYHQQWLVRCAAAEVLGGIGSPAASAVPDLITLLWDHDAELRSSAVAALSAIARSAASVVHQLIELLESTRGYVRFAAIEVLRELGPPAAPALPELVTLLGDDDAKVRLAVVEVLRAIGPCAKSAAPELINLFRDDAAPVRSAAVEALSELDPTAASAQPEIITLLRDGNAEVRSAAARALEKVGPTAASALPDVIALLRDGNAEVRSAAVSILAKVGPSAASAVGDLANCLCDKEWNVSWAAAEAVGSLGAFAAPAVPKLIQLLRNEKLLARWAAATALTEMMARGVRVFPVPKSTCRVTTADELSAGRRGPE